MVFLLADRKLYAQALSCFYQVHKQLGISLRAAVKATGDTDMRAFAPLLLEASRTTAFEADLEFYLGPSWRSQLIENPAIDAYVAHLKALEVTQPLALIAHAYTQHMALLAGGRLLSRSLTKGLGLEPGGPGVAVFTFPRRDRTGRGLQGDYKDALNGLGRDVDDEVREALLREHAAAFELNNAIIRAFPMGVGTSLRIGLRTIATTWWIAGPLVLTLAWQAVKTWQA